MMHSRTRFWALAVALVVLAFVGGSPRAAHVARAQEPAPATGGRGAEATAVPEDGVSDETLQDAPPGVVTVVMFYAPTCPHCHDIITAILPPLQMQYGDALDLVLISTRSPEGNRLFWSTMGWLGVAESDAGTPAILIGDRFLLGGEHATARLADTIADAVAEGGAALPEIPGLAEAVAMQRAAPDEPLTVEDMSVDQRLALDPAGSVVALAMLAVMLVSAILAVDAWRRSGPAGADGGGWPTWLLPALCCVGLVVAGYLAYVEMTDARAVCGPVGQCNTVQQSPYAKLLGVLPIGVLGVAGYLSILALWLWSRLGPEHLTWRTRWLLPLVVLFGVVFSIYLTFLEPFVIGAVCMWCIGSAVVMTALLWTTVPLQQARAQVPWLRRGRGPAKAEPGLAAGGEATDPGREAAATGEASGSAASHELSAPSWPSALRRAVTVAGYVLAAFLGLVVAAVVTVLAKTYLFPPPAITSVAEANQRAALENATLVAGLVLGVFVWHAVRAARSR